ncbi:MAG: serine/threonine-protein kinase [Leptolyngbyaceae cyanobacterium bins.59]|nr:serine/threonine-protein kinase [Leptolyngbyaceae cyanobacterium bins.59]
MKLVVDDSSNSSSSVLSHTRSQHGRNTPSFLKDRYRVLRTLGRGGFGVTYLARDLYLPCSPLCVVKQLCPKIQNAMALENARLRFYREAEMLSKLGSHAQIPRLLDYFEIDSEFYLVQEYVRGATLAREVQRSGPWSEQAVKEFLRQILPLLQFLHRNRIIHRDIKPQNLIRCHDDGRLVLIDFGAVKERVGQIGVSDMEASTTHFVGTIGFAPPEQIAMRPVFASDLYALGLTCLYLLTGAAPLQYDYDSQTGETSWQHLVEVSDHFARVITKMLRISLAERYHSADEILRSLNLEPYLDNLSPCLTHQPHPLVELNRSEPEGDRYLTPNERAARSIRDWRDRIKIRQLRSQKFFPL